WEKAVELQKKYSKTLELIKTPYEMVPTNENALYPRLTHFKETVIEVAGTKGEWIPQIAMVSSANLTDSCLKCRISQSKVNKERYLKGDKYAYAKGSQGHVQFGAIIKGSAVLTTLIGPVERWIELYRQGKHFDAAPLTDKQFPRLVFGEG